MIVQSLWDIQKNIWIISERLDIIKIIDKRKKEHIATIIPKRKKNSILHIWWILKNKIPKDKKNIDFSLAREFAKELYFKEKLWKS